jgi:hypothetical protein
MISLNALRAAPCEEADADSTLTTTMPIPNIDHCRVCSGELSGEERRPHPRRRSHIFEPESSREQGPAKLGIDGRGREDFDFIIQLLAEALGGRGSKANPTMTKRDGSGSLSRDCQWLGSASTGPWRPNHYEALPGGRIDGPRLTAGLHRGSWDRSDASPPLAHGNFAE